MINISEQNLQSFIKKKLISKRTILSKSFGIICERVTLNDKTDLSKVFLSLKNNLEDKLNNYSEVNIDDIRLEMLSKSWKFNEKIEFISNSLNGSGIFEGISDNYEILIRTDTDQIKLNSGELKLIRK